MEGNSIQLENAIAKLEHAANTSAVPFRLATLSSMNSAQCSAFLLSRECGVALMPSMMENIPFTAAEVLSLGVPFLMTAVGGNTETLHPDDVSAATFPPTVTGLQQRLLQLFREGARQARPAPAQGCCLQLTPPCLPRSQWRPNPASYTAGETWSDWHSRIVAPPPPPVVRSGANESVTVVVATFNPQPALLEEAIVSLEAQDFPAERLEVVLVDDGSTDQRSLSYMRELEPRFARSGWRVLHTPNGYLGAARNAGMQNATR